MTAAAYSGISREYRRDMGERLRGAYIDRAMEFHGLGEVQAHLRSVGFDYAPETLVRQIDNEVRKQLEAEGYTPVNPTARNGYLRSFTAPDVIKADSLVTRERGTRSRRRRDLRQHENLVATATDATVRAKSRFELDMAAAIELMQETSSTFAHEIEEAIRAEARELLDGES